jgi:hypothetical protein
MKAMLLIAQSAANHQDGSLSMLRGCLGALNIAQAYIKDGKPTVNYRGSLVILITGNPIIENYDHDLLITCIDQDGQRLPNFRLVEKFTLAKNGLSIGSFDIGIQFTKFDTYNFQLYLDGQIADTYTFTVRPA